ncbi:MAG: hypothetical protein WC560_02700 [Syntrophales bacterium]
MSTKSNLHNCTVCGKEFSSRAIVRGAIVGQPVAQLIRRDHPDWSDDSYICRDDLAKYRANYVHSILESERARG